MEILEEHLIGLSCEGDLLVLPHFLFLLISKQDVVTVAIASIVD